MSPIGDTALYQSNTRTTMDELTPQAADVLLDLIEMYPDDALACAQKQYDSPGTAGAPEDADAKTFLSNIVTALGEAAGTAEDGD